MHDDTARTDAPSVFPLELASERLRLREFEPTDLQDVQRYTGDAQAVDHVAFGPNQLVETETYLHRAIAAARVVPRRSYEVAITHDRTSELIGSIRLGLTSDLNRDASLGYFLRRDLWGRGLATEAAKLLVSFGFERLELHRIWATCSTENAASARLLEKLGVRREGHLREDVRVRGRWRDSYVYAVLEREWHQH